MAEYHAEVEWQRGEAVFTDKRYSRRHLLRFDGGIEVAGSSSPLHVRLPWSDPAAIDPEEAFVAALASCHLLTFLYAAARRGYRVDRYRDDAVGVMARDDAGRDWISVVTLRPDVVFSGALVPTRDEIEALHHEAHDTCFIAASVRSEVRCEPVFPTS
ncbi:MAG: OsmC family protein [Gemmatimonadota bacterium]